MFVSRGRSLRLLSAALALGLAAAACGGKKGGTGNGVDVTLADFSITLGSTSAKAGEVTFKVKNSGPSVHEFVVFKTSLAPEALPTVDENGIPIVDEAGEGLESVDEIEDIAVGSTAELKVTLTAGSYVLLCNVPAHYQQGMHVAFTVSS